MGRENDCRICEKKYSRFFANLFDSKVKVHGSENYIISYFEAIQQLTGMEVCNNIEFVYIYFTVQRQCELCTCLRGAPLLLIDEVFHF